MTANYTVILSGFAEGKYVYTHVSLGIVTRLVYEGRNSITMCPLQSGNMARSCAFKLVGVFHTDRPVAGHTHILVSRVTRCALG